MLSAVTLSFADLELWMPWAQSVPSAQELRGVLSEGQTAFDGDREWNYALFERISGELVGSAGLHRDEDPDCPEIGYWVRSDRTGRGYATTAARTLAGAAFAYLADVGRVKIRMDQANLASAAVPPKLGFELFGEENREIAARGQTGQGFVWVLDRAKWTAAAG